MACTELAEVLPNPCVIIKQIDIEKILETVQNVAYIGVLRQRWEEIKRLQIGKYELVTAS